MTPRQVQILIAVGALAAIALVVLVVAVVVGWEDPMAAPASLPTSTSSPEPTSTTSSSPSTTNPASTTTSSTTTSSTTSTSTSTSTTTTTTLPPGACTEEDPYGVSAGSILLAEATGDFDGDGNGGDHFSLLSHSDAGTGALIELSYGYSRYWGVFTPQHFMADARVVNLGGPADLVLTRIDGSSVTLWTFHECTVRLVTADMSALGLPRLMMNYPVVSNLVEKRGFRCQEDGIVVTAATSDDGVSWWAMGLRFVWDPVTATLNPPPSPGGIGAIPAAILLHSPEDDAVIQSYADFDC